MDSKLIDVYTDGSFHDTAELRDKTYGAIYLPSFEDGEDKWQFYTDKPMYTQSRNVGGEVLAAEFAISLIARYYDKLSESGPVEFKVNLYYDYEGVGKWITGEWRWKKVLTQNYHRYVWEQLRDRRIMLFPHHVKGHTGCEGNEIVDRLATNAFQSDKCYNANSFIESILK